MNEYITQISIRGTKIGLIGLADIIEEVKSLNLTKDTEIKKHLLEKVKIRNYVPDSRKDDYARALLREYKKSIGLPVEEEKSTELTFRVLGPGCYACEQLEKDLRAVLAELGIPANVEHVRDLNEIAQYGMIRTPGLVIKDKVVLNGRALPRNKLKQLVSEILNR